jgi:hypothetical protein
MVLKVIVAPEETLQRLHENFLEAKAFSRLFF